jgi:pimeloyl-ACP methyl ester carboxylesterase
VRNSLPAEMQNPVERKAIGAARAFPSVGTDVEIEEHWLDLVDGRMRYLKAGSGPTLILIHGLLGYSFSWRFTMPTLAQHATVYAIDNLGAGLSTSRDGMDCTMRGTASRILEFADALRITDFDLLGTSHGGGVAIMVAAVCVERNDARLQRLILSAPVNPWSQHGKRLAPFLGRPLGSLLFRNTVERWRFLDPVWLRRMFGDESKIPADSLDGYRVPILKNQATRHGTRIVKTWTEDLSDLEAALPTIRDYRTLLLWGTKDGAVDIRSAEPLQRNFRDARLVEFEGVGHLPYEEAPEDFNRALVEFLTARNPT